MSKEFQTTWNMMNNNGSRYNTNDDFFVNPDIYDFFGEIALWPIDLRIPVSVSIDVVPEPATLLLFGTGFIVVLAHSRKKNVI